MRFFFASLVALSPLTAHAQELLANPSFEDDEEVCGFPSGPGDWGVDAMTVVGAEGGVAPRTGAQMLRMEFPFFVQTASGCVGASGGSSTDAAQLVDVSSCHPAGTHARLRLTAHFNAATGAGVSGYSCLIRAFAGVTSDFGMVSTTPLAEATAMVTPDTDPAAWQRCEVELDLPAGATYVAAFIGSRVASGGREVYADDLSLVPVAGRCGFDCTATGAVCPDASAVPDATLCDTGTGACVACLADADCDDGVECTEEACTLGACDRSVSPPGTPCSTGVCDGATKGAACVECLTDDDCDAGETCDGDACVSRDAGADDAGADDAGADDAGAGDDAGPRDAGAALDAGRDAGVPGADAGPTPVTTGGCGCTVGGRSPLAGLPALLLLGVLAARRRR